MNKFIGIVVGLLSLLSFINGDPTLNVFVVPHSHCDPGWWKTYTEYYDTWTRGIINSVIDSLLQDEKRTFIWAEVSFFQLWWKEQKEEKKEAVKKLAKSGRFEFVTGGWVMSDEANVHYVDVVDQLTEGHKWIEQNIGVKPRVGWSIDPFGHSPLIPYLLSQSGFYATVINRVHQNTKQQFRNNHNLEFIWRQNWVNEPSAQLDLFTHMLAYPLYDIPNTCGPSWDTCEKFDFERSVAIPITDSNARDRAMVLLHQYRQKASNFKHNNVLIPLGDDFKYKTLDMTLKIFNSYQKMFDAINSDKSLNVNIKFASLTEYFEAIERSQDVTPELSFPVYQGDFFTYNDREADYWSGYYTTRPFLKGLSRRASSTLRSAYVMFSLAKTIKKNSSFNWDMAYHNMEECRRAISLFQHHDGITGTSKEAVITDYRNQLGNALNNVKEVVRDLTQLLLAENSVENTITLGEEQTLSKELPKLKKIDLKNDPAAIIVHNSLGTRVKQVVRIIVTDPNVKVLDTNGNEVASQVNFMWDKPNGLDLTTYLLYFVVDVPALGFLTYFLQPNSPPTRKVEVKSSLSLFDPPNSFNVQSLSQTDITIENGWATVHLSSTGLLKSIQLKDSQEEVKFSEGYYGYQTRRGGAYIFSPTGEATKLPGSVENTIHFMSGPLVDEVVVQISSILAHRVILFKSGFPEIDNHIEVTNLVDIGKVSMMNNHDLIIRYDTNINNNKVFYTDANGVELQKRMYDSKLPIAGNYYPITTAAVLQDSKWKASVLVKQALGMTSLKEGQIEIMLDRKLNQDDGRGMGEGVSDSLLTDITFWITLEHYDETFTGVLTQHERQLSLNYPSHVLHVASSAVQIGNKAPFLKGIKSELAPLGYDVNLPAMSHLLSFESTTAERNDILLVRLINLSPLGSISLDLEKLLCGFEINDIQQTSLTTIHGPLHVQPFRSNEMDRLYRLDKPTYHHTLQSPEDLKLPGLSLRPLEIKTLLISVNAKTEQLYSKPPIIQPETAAQLPSLNIPKLNQKDTVSQYNGKTPEKHAELVNKIIGSRPDKDTTKDLPRDTPYVMLLSIPLTVILCFFVLGKKQQRRISQIVSNPFTLFSRSRTRNFMGV